MGRDTVLKWLAAGVAAVDPETLTREALHGLEGAKTVIAIGKAAPAMCRGADAALNGLRGICVAAEPSPVPDGVELWVGDHPTPGIRSLAAGLACMEHAGRADLALISGGGSSLAEVPIQGVGLDRLTAINTDLLRSGANIEEINAVRTGLSAIKGGGLGPLSTYILSDVGPARPGVVSSGPTIPGDSAYDVHQILSKYGIEDVDQIVVPSTPSEVPRVVRVIGDGLKAAAGVAAAATEEGLSTAICDHWVSGAVEEELERFWDKAPHAEVLVAAGEPTVRVQGSGRGGRSSHTALLAAKRLRGANHLFAAMATDGVDGNSGFAGAIVDRSTFDHEASARAALATFDSASYLASANQLIDTGPTGTNVADLWVLWRR